MCMHEMTTEIMPDEECEINMRQRVRLFNFNENDSQWCERGIGEVSTYFKESSNENFLLIHAESDDSLLLESKIEQDTAYRKEQDRFIIWTEGDTVLGLSFQENAGCNDIWEAICQVQGKDPLVLLEQETVEDNVTDEEDIVEEQKIPEEVIVDQSKNIVEESADNVAREVWFEEMLDIEHAQLSVYERDVLGQLIELVNRLVAPAPEEKAPLPEESQLLDLYSIHEDIPETEGFHQLHETILYLLSLNRERHYISRDKTHLQKLEGGCNVTSK